MARACSPWSAYARPRWKNASASCGSSRSAVEKSAMRRGRTAAAGVGHAAVVIRPGELRVQPDGGVVIGERFLFVAERRVGVGPVEKDAGGLRVELDRRREIGDRVVVLFPAGIDDAAAVQRIGIVGGEANRFGEVGDGRVVVAQVGVGHAAVVIGGRVVGPQVDGGGEIVGGRRERTAPGVGVGPEEIEVGVGRVGFDGLRERFDRPVMFAAAEVELGPGSAAVSGRAGACPFANSAIIPGTGTAGTIASRRPRPTSPRRRRT